MSKFTVFVYCKSWKKLTVFFNYAFNQTGVKIRNSLGAPYTVGHGDVLDKSLPSTFWPLNYIFGAIEKLRVKILTK